MLDTQVCAVCCAVKLCGAPITPHTNAEKYDMSLMSANQNSAHEYDGVHLRDTGTHEEINTSVSYPRAYAWHPTVLSFVWKVNVNFMALKWQLALLRCCKQTKVILRKITFIVLSWQCLSLDVLRFWIYIYIFFLPMRHMRTAWLLLDFLFTPLKSFRSSSNCSLFIIMGLKSMAPEPHAAFLPISC